MNQQPPTRPSFDMNFLKVHRIYPTIQCEGPFAGSPATFVSFAGCNLQCPNCDADYSISEVMTPEDIDEMCAKNGHSLVVLTGGEPFNQNLIKLLDQRFLRSASVQIETNGTRWLTGDRLPKNVYTVISPKTAEVNYHWAKADMSRIFWKYIVGEYGVHEDDGLPLKSLGYFDLPARPTPGTPRAGIYLQPEWVAFHEQYYRNVQTAVGSCMRYGYRLSMQTHKLVGGLDGSIQN